MKRVPILLGAMVALVSATLARAQRAELIDRILVVVHDSVITQHDVASLSLGSLGTLQSQYRGAEFERQAAQLFGNNQEKLVNERLILHEFATAGYSLPESVIDELVRSRIRERFGDEITLTRSLETMGMTKEKFRQEIRDTFIIRALREKNVSSEIIISPHKIQIYYEQHTNDFKESERAKLRMIMIKAPKGDETERERTRVKGREILTRLKEGASFAEMSQYSQENLRSFPGGEHGWMDLSSLAKELANAASALNQGQISDLVETQGDTEDAIWIIQAEEKKPAHVKPLSEVRDQIDKKLKEDEQRRLEIAWIQKLKKKTYIKTF